MAETDNTTTDTPTTDTPTTDTPTTDTPTTDTPTTDTPTRSGTQPADSPPGGPGTGRPRLAWRPLWLVAGIVAAVHLAVATRYGWHHDEFYYVMSGRHLAWGYVDQPPLVPLLARLAAARN